MTSGGFDSPLVPLSNPCRVLFPLTHFIGGKIGSVSKFEHFQDIPHNQLPKVYLVLMHTEAVRFVTPVFSCSRACTRPAPAVDRRGQAGEIFFSTVSADLFNKRHLINRLSRSINCPHVSDHAKPRVYECVSLWFLMPAEWWASRGAC